MVILWSFMVLHGLLLWQNIVLIGLVSFFLAIIDPNSFGLVYVNCTSLWFCDYWSNECMLKQISNAHFHLCIILPSELPQKNLKKEFKELEVQNSILALKVFFHLIFSSWRLMTALCILNLFDALCTLTNKFLCLNFEHL